MNGSLPLHLVCDLTVAEMLLKAYSGGVDVRNDGGYLPLHRAVAWHSPQSPEFVNLLLKEERIQRQKNRKNLAREGEWCLMVKNKNGQTPIEIAFERIALLVHHMAYGSPRQSNREIRGIWEIFEMLVWEVWSRTHSLNDEFLILHAILKLEAPPQTIQQILLRYPDQVTQRDAECRLPLHVAAIYYGASSYCLKVMNILLDPKCGFPSAISMFDPITGGLTLHLAAMGGMTFYKGLGTLLMAEPKALKGTGHC